MSDDVKKNLENSSVEKRPTAIADDGRELEIISRTEAKELGLKRYFTGKPYNNGHIDERIVSSRGCLSCVRVRSSVQNKVRYAPIKKKNEEAHQIEEERLNQLYPNRISLKEARAQGLTRYFTGKPCKNGHISERLVSGRKCIECALIAQKEREHKKVVEAQQIRYEQWKREELELDKKHPNRISQEKASELGLFKFFTGRPCKNGHIAERYVNGGGCVVCHAEASKRNDNPERHARWYRENIDKARKRDKEYRQNKPEKSRERSRRWRERNPERAQEVQRRSVEKNRDKRNARRRERRKTDVGFLLSETYRTRILRALKSDGAIKIDNSLELLGCTIPEFIEHLKGTMTEGMSWDMFLKTDRIHVDHVKPLAAFNLSKPEEQKIAFHWSNHQLLWKEDNMKKGPRYNGIDYRYIDK